VGRLAQEVHVRRLLLGVLVGVVVGWFPAGAGAQDAEIVLPLATLPVLTDLATGRAVARPWGCASAALWHATCES
jgi:hypothetical protein